MKHISYLNIIGGFLTVIFIFLLVRKAVVGLLTSTTITGFYAIAERIAYAAQTFPLLSLAQAIFPRLSKIFSKKKSLAFDIMRQIQQITTYIASVSLLAIFILAPFIV